MPRSYSFDHFQAKNPIAEKELRFGAEKHKQHLHDAEATAIAHTDVHYGRKFSQTEEILHARQMEHQLEELAGLTHEEKAAPKQKRAPKRPEAQPIQRTAATGAAPGAAIGAPIGALPATEEPMPQTMMRELWDEASRHLRVVGLAARDVSRASVRLVTLPLRAAQLAARKIRPRHA